MPIRNQLFAAALRHAGTQQILADRIGITQPHVSQILRGKRRLTPAIIHGIRRAWPSLDALAVAALVELPADSRDNEKRLAV